MKNITMTREGDILTLKIDLSKRFEKSSSGKSISIASTQGNVAVTDSDNIKIGINCYTPVSD